MILNFISKKNTVVLFYEILIYFYTTNEADRVGPEGVQLLNTPYKITAGVCRQW